MWAIFNVNMSVVTWHTCDEDEEEWVCEKDHLLESEMNIESKGLVSWIHKDHLNFYQRAEEIHAVSLS